MTKKSLMDWAKAHCSEHSVDEYIDTLGNGVFYNTYKFNWRGYMYRLTLIDNDDYVYFDRFDDNYMDFSECLPIDEVVISDDKLFIAAIPREFYK